MLTPERALELLEQVVAEFGEDYIYIKPSVVGCLYWFDGRPSCLVGQVLHRSGLFTDEEIAYCDGEVGAGGGGYGDTPASNLSLRFPGRVYSQAAQILGQAQCAQDTGETWGSALRRAQDYWARTQGEGTTGGA